MVGGFADSCFRVIWKPSSEFKKVWTWARIQPCGPKGAKTGKSARPMDLNNLCGRLDPSPWKESSVERTLDDQIVEDKARIVIGEDNEDHRHLMERALTRLGHEVVATAASGSELLKACERHSPDLVITDIRMPEMDGLDAAKHIYDVQPVPIIVVTSQLDEGYVERAQEQHVLAFLRKPVEADDLKPTIAIARSRFSEFESLKSENNNLQQALEDRKIIERAKGILMKQASITEEEAFLRLQKLARDKRQKLATVGEMIITAAKAME